MKFSVKKNDFEVTWFSGGKGGQKINGTQPFCRLKHKDTGIIKIETSHRERERNQKEALLSMPKDPFSSCVL